MRRFRRRFRSGELIRRLSRNNKQEFPVQGATMWVQYKAPQHHKETVQGMVQEMAQEMVQETTWWRMRAWIFSEKIR